MKEKINTAVLDIWLLIKDFAGAAIASVTMESFVTGAIHWIGTISATIVGGSCLFILQKTVLPKISNWLNK